MLPAAEPPCLAHKMLAIMLCVWTIRLQKKGISMKIRYAIGAVLFTAAFVATGCAAGEPEEGVLRMSNATVTRDGNSATISGEGLSISTESFVADGDDLIQSVDWCCSGCNMQSGNCNECHTCSD